MGKRKKAAKKPTGKKKNEPLPTNFSCLFCNHEKSVVVKIDRKAGFASLACKVCSQKFHSSINYLTLPVDVYADWVDACDTVAKKAGPAADGGHAGGDNVASSRVPAAGKKQRDDGRTPTLSPSGDEDEDEDGDRMGGYGGRDEGIVGDDES